MTTVMAWTAGLFAGDCVVFVQRGVAAAAAVVLVAAVGGGKQWSSSVSLVCI